VIRVYDAARQGNRDARAQGRFPRSRVARAALLPPDHKGRCRLSGIAFGIPGQIFEPSCCARALCLLLLSLALGYRFLPRKPRQSDSGWGGRRDHRCGLQERAGTEIFLLGDFFFPDLIAGTARCIAPRQPFYHMASNEFPRSGSCCIENKFFSRSQSAISDRHCVAAVFFPL
jgi:hypothetical protein